MIDLKYVPLLFVEMLLELCFERDIMSLLVGIELREIY